MNYFAHGRLFLDTPYFAAGTAVPDWLCVLDRKIRVRPQAAQTLVSHPDERVAAVAGGILQHRHDDAWFHRTRAFAELNLQLTAEVRKVLPQDDGFRPSFLGHILVEILLDAALIADAPEQLDAYQAALDSIDPLVVADAINQVTTRPSELWPVFIPRFSAERFLYDYQEDAKLLSRLNRVMRRVQMQPLPEAFLSILPPTRHAVARRRQELLTAP